MGNGDECERPFRMGTGSKRWTLGSHETGASDIIAAILSTCSNTSVESGFKASSQVCHGMVQSRGCVSISSLDWLKALGSVSVGDASGASPLFLPKSLRATLLGVLEDEPNLNLSLTMDGAEEGVEWIERLDCDLLSEEDGLGTLNPLEGESGC